MAGARMFGARVFGERVFGARVFGARVFGARVFGGRVPRVGQRGSLEPGKHVSSAGSTDDVVVANVASGVFNVTGVLGDGGILGATGVLDVAVATGERVAWTVVRTGDSEGRCGRDVGLAGTKVVTSASSHSATSQPPLQICKFARKKVIFNIRWITPPPTFNKSPQHHTSRKPAFDQET